MPNANALTHNRLSVFLLRKEAIKTVYPRSAKTTMMLPVFKYRFMQCLLHTGSAKRPENEIAYFIEGIIRKQIWIN